MAKDSTKTLLKQLKDPFEPRLVKWTNKGGKSPTPLAYIDARDVMKRLDDIVPGDWQSHFREVNGGMICELSIRIDGEWQTRSDAASNTKIEPIKGGTSDALKRAANAWGIGRYLYYLPTWCNRDNQSEWPAWARPNSSLENWEDIAEMEAEAGTGMDFDEDSVIEGSELVWAVKSTAELEELVKTLGDEQASALADDINAKRRELFHASRVQSDTSKTSAA